MFHAGMPMMRLFPSPGAPYYIVSPPYTEKSAGVKVLHMLCHALNMSGQRAYMIVMNTPPQGGEDYCSQFVTPPLTPVAAQFYSMHKIDPIYVYPDIIRGNPFNAARAVRWLLAPAGAFGGDKTFPASDSVWSYSTRIAEAAGHPNVLHCPAADPGVFSPSPGVERRGTCFYSHKHRVLGGTLTGLVSGSTEINRQLSQADLIKLLQHSEWLYLYEDSFLAMEAVLCGCPVVFLPNEQFQACKSVEDYGRYGIAYGNEPSQIAEAKATVAQGREAYFQAMRQFWEQLRHFIAETQTCFPLVAAVCSENRRMRYSPSVA